MLPPVQVTVPALLTERSSTFELVPARLAVPPAAMFREPVPDRAPPAQLSTPARPRLPGPVTVPARARTPPAPTVPAPFRVSVCPVMESVWVPLAPPTARPATVASTSRLTV